VKTGVQAILNGLKILDSGFRRNDGKRCKPIFSQLPPSEGEGNSRVSGWTLFSFPVRGELVEPQKNTFARGSSYFKLGYLSTDLNHSLHLGFLPLLSQDEGNQDKPLTS
jgi:hypothetical protein